MFSESLYNLHIFSPLRYNYIINSENSYLSESDLETMKLTEIKSKNNFFFQEKDIKFELYPLYINWKKIELKLLFNPDFNIFKVFGYFGSAIYNILIQAFPHNVNFYNSKNLIKELFLIYKKKYNKDEIKQNIFYKKLVNIYDDVISLIKNKIIIFKEISIFLTVMKLYETYYITIDDKDKLTEVLKYQYFILNNITDEEYLKIYNTFYKRININHIRYLSQNKYKFPINKKCYINSLRNIYKLTKQEIKEKK